MPLLFLFILMPIAEMWVLIEVGSRIGTLPTIGLVLLSAMVGLALLRRQGLSTLLRANQKTAAGELPIKEMVEGIFLAVGGVLLLTPGFITDALGLACLIPGVRQLLIGKLLKPVIRRAGGGQYTHFRQQQGEDIIEGEFYRQEDTPSSRDRLP